jgi:hypothetical protein
MRPILFLLCLSLALPSLAQRFAAGLRTGATYWPNSTHYLQITKGNSGFNWEKSVYGRYESKGRFAAELGISYNHFNYTYAIPQWTEFAPPINELLSHRSTSDVFTANAMAQIRVTKNASKLTSYFGAGISYGRHFERHNFILQNVKTGEVFKDAPISNNALVACGINNYTSYAISQHLNIHSVISFDIDPFSALSSFAPATQYVDSRLAWSIGCGYTF